MNWARTIFFILIGLKSSIAQIAANQNIKTIYNNYQIVNQPNKTADKSQQTQFYKKYISKQISANCQFNATCSSFMVEARQRFGFGKGLLLGIDRLSRCGASEETYNNLPSLKVQNTTTFIDHIHFYD
jgi:putative component of membrane protein insertase Oxa1/YidC/SpoIIIJ protein YidD